MHDVSLETIAQQFSPRHERHGDNLLVVDVCGLERLLGDPRVIARELRREAADRGVHVHVAVAGTRTAALVLALARPGVTVVDRGGEAAALAPLPIGILEHVYDAFDDDHRGDRRARREAFDQPSSAVSVVSALKRWGLQTLGDLAALPAADLAARLGPRGLACRAIARGEDCRPLVPALADERFESSIELEWPIEGLEPLSFVLTRLLEPLATRLERRDRGAAVLHVELGLVTRGTWTRRLELPAPLRDVRTLRALALIDLESHPPPAAVDAVAVTIDPTPGRVLQHSLLERAAPAPDAIATLLARLGALLGQDRIGAPATVDSFCPGAFAMKPFAIEHDDDRRSTRRDRRETFGQLRAPSSQSLASALRRCRPPVPARVAVVDGRPARVTTDRRGYAGGVVLACAGPWRTSGSWWSGSPNRGAPAAMPGPPARHPRWGGVPGPPARHPRWGGVPSLSPEPRGEDISVSTRRGAGSQAWDREEWDVALADGGVYRMFRDGEAGGWFLDAVAD